MARHTHQYTIADDEALKVLLTTQKVRKAFFHGLLTGYAVALKLW